VDSAHSVRGTHRNLFRTRDPHARYLTRKPSGVRRWVTDLGPPTWGHHLLDERLFADPVYDLVTIAIGGFTAFDLASRDRGGVEGRLADSSQNLWLKDLKGIGREATNLDLPQVVPIRQLFLYPDQIVASVFLDVLS
jgi:hypothetical protein